MLSKTARQLNIKKVLLAGSLLLAVGVSFTTYKVLALEGKNIPHGQNQIYEIANAVQDTDNYSSKSSAKGWLLYANGQVGSDFQLPTFSTTDTYVRACATVRRTEGPGPLKLQINSTPFNATVTPSVSNSSHYQRVCTDYGRFTPGAVHNIKVTVANQSPGYWMYVHTIALEW